jgi:hypothetical protein
MTAVALRVVRNVGSEEYGSSDFGDSDKEFVLQPGWAAELSVAKVDQMEADFAETGWFEFDGDLSDGSQGDQVEAEANAEADAKQAEADRLAVVAWAAELTEQAAAQLAEVERLTLAATPAPAPAPTPKRKPKSTAKSSTKTKQS